MPVLQALPILWATILCLAVNFVGSSSHGSSRWLNIFGVSFSHQELAKIAVILYLAVVISKRPMAMRTFRGNVKLLATILPIFLVVAYNNLSTKRLLLPVLHLLWFLFQSENSTISSWGVRTCSTSACICLLVHIVRSVCRYGCIRKILIKATRRYKDFMQSDLEAYLAKD